MRTILEGQEALATCINKKYKGRKITHYQLQTNTGETVWVQADKLKDAIINHGLKVKNIKVTSDGRLITVK